MRLGSPTAFMDELGSECFTFVLTADTSALSPSNSNTGLKAAKEFQAPVVLGTASFRPYRHKEYSTLDPISQAYSRKDDPALLEPWIDNWEIKLLAVDPSIQKQGIASLMLRLVEEEIRRRWEAAVVGELATVGAKRDRSKGKERKLRLLLSTLKEMNAAFYERRGWVLTEDRRMGKGFQGSEIGFGSGFMEKWG